MHATIQDLIAAFGNTEIVRLTTPDGSEPAGIVAPRAHAALSAASDLADGYLRARYQLPPVPIPAALRDKVCALARYQLAHGEQRSPTEQMKQAHEDALAWLKLVATGTVKLDLPAPSTNAGQMSETGLASRGGARTQDRVRVRPSDYRGYT
jgi:phage gp36-like protein